MSRFRSTGPTANLEAGARSFRSSTVDIKKLLADGDMVMVEGLDNFEVGGKPFALEIAAVSEVDDEVSSAAGVISYDLEPIEARIASAFGAQLNES